VQVVDETGKNLGVLDTYKAIEIAQERGLDLVEIAPTVKPPVCKITDYGKYKYQQAKKEQQQKAKQKTIEVKGIRIGLSTSSHDLEYKAKQAGEFLGEGNKVRIEIRLRGREKAHQDLAREKLNDFLKLITTAYKIEEEPKRNPMGLIMTVAKE
jgi:translation initiation factor IF-3